MGLQDVRVGDRLKLTATWFQPMLFEEGQYRLTLPFILPEDALRATGVTTAEILDFSCFINTGTQDEVRYAF